jgi:hypothetical protein
MKHVASVKFWSFFSNLPKEIQQLARKNFGLMKMDPRHGSLHLKKIDRYWSVRVGIHYRALAIESDEYFVWFWIGHHSDYDHLIKR